VQSRYGVGVVEKNRRELVKRFNVDFRREILFTEALGTRR
jgi:hypothetical protein